jgi:hypothetical protein
MADSFVIFRQVMEVQPKWLLGGEYFLFVAELLLKLIVSHWLSSRTRVRHASGFGVGWMWSLGIDMVHDPTNIKSSPLSPEANSNTTLR